MRLAETSVLVTGAASGLGRATAQRFANSGAHVVMVDMAANLSEAADAIGGQATSVAADVTNSAELNAAFDQAAGFPPIRAVVHCAGRGGDGRRILDREHRAIPSDVFAEVIRINLIGSYTVVAVAAEQMSRNELLATGRGAIVLTSSIASYEGQIGQAAYAASKAGINGLTLVAARDLASVGIRVNAIAPGIFDTPMLARVAETVRQRIADSIPYPRRLGTPDDYAHMAQTLIENPYVNGDVVRLDGALRMSPR